MGVYNQPPFPSSGQDISTVDLTTSSSEEANSYNHEDSQCFDPSYLEASGLAYNERPPDVQAINQLYHSPVAELDASGCVSNQENSEDFGLGWNLYGLTPGEILEQYKHCLEGIRVRDPLSTLNIHNKS